MPKTVKKNVYYYDVEAFQFDSHSHLVPTDIDSIFLNICSLSPDKRDLNNSVITVSEVELVCSINPAHCTTEYMCGQFGRLRDDLPKGIRGGKLTRLRLSPDTDLFEPVHFIYFKNTKIIAIEWNQSAPRHIAFAKYLTELSKAKTWKLDEVNLYFKVQKKTLERLRKLKNLTSIQISASSSQIENMGNTRTAKALKAHKEQFRGEYKIETILKPIKPRKGWGFFPSTVKADIIRFSRTDAGFLEDLIVYAKSGSGARTVKVDLLEDRFIAQLKVKKADDFNIDEDDFFSKIITHYNENNIGD